MARLRVKYSVVVEFDERRGSVPVERADAIAEAISGRLGPVVDRTAEVVKVSRGAIWRPSGAVA